MRSPIEVLGGGPILHIGGSRVVLTPRLGLRVAEQLIRRSTRELVDQAATEREQQLQRTVRTSSRRK